MDANVEANRATMTRWYNEMWGKCDSSKVKDCIAPNYLRHDATGANNTVTVESYSRTVRLFLGDLWIKDFKYIAIVEGNFIGTMARFMIADQLQWDWVQLFRTENNRLAETWLPGIGGSDVRSIPTAVTSWCGTELPSQDLVPMTANKELVKAWFERLASGSDCAELLCDNVRNHDITHADQTFDAAGFEAHWRGLMQNEKASDLRLFMIEEKDIVFAAGMWSIGDSNREWNWIQAFRIEDGKIAQAWLPSIGGTDPSLEHSTDIVWSADVIPDWAVRVGRDFE